MVDHLRVGFVTIPTAVRRLLTRYQAFHAVAIHTFKTILSVDIRAHFQGMLPLKLRPTLVAGMIFPGCSSKILPADIIILMTGQTGILAGRCNLMPITAVTVQAICDMATLTIVGEKLIVIVTKAFGDKFLLGTSHRHGLIENPVIA